jgi:DNA-binding NarL/FixJ family response regulator
MISILLADDHPLILRGLSNLFTACGDLRVVGEESDACRVVEAVARLEPDVLVLDLMMPGMSGMEIIRQIARSRPRTRIVVLSMHANVAYVWEALRNGALAYVLKCVESEELIFAVREVGARRRYLSASISELELEEYASKVQQHGLDSYDMLTKRERQVLRLVAEGGTSAQIAQQLHIGIRTVETYRAHLLAKLNLRNQAELVRYAIQRGLVILV